MIKLNAKCGPNTPIATAPKYTKMLEINRHVVRIYKNETANRAQSEIIYTIHRKSGWAQESNLIGDVVTDYH